MKISQIYATAFLTILAVHNTRPMHYINTVIQKGLDNAKGHGVAILKEVDQNTFKCTLTNIQDLHRCEWGIEDLITQNKTDDLVRLLKEFKKREILTRLNSMSIENANSHIVVAYQKSNEVEKVQAWVSYCQLEKITLDTVNATKAKNFIIERTDQELKNGYTQLQQTVLRLQEFIKGIHVTQDLKATGPYPNFDDYKTMDTIFALMKMKFEKQEKKEVENKQEQKAEPKQEPEKKQEAEKKN